MFLRFGAVRAASPDHAQTHCIGTGMAPGAPSAASRGLLQWIDASLCQNGDSERALSVHRNVFFHNPYYFGLPLHSADHRSSIVQNVTSECVTS